MQADSEKCPERASDDEINTMMQRRPQKLQTTPSLRSAIKGKQNKTKKFSYILCISLLTHLQASAEPAAPPEENMDSESA